MEREVIEEISTKCEMVKLGMRHTKDGHVLALAIHPNDTPHELLQDPLGQRYMVVMVRTNDQGEPVASAATADGMAAVKLAATLCKDARFQGWLCIQELADEASEEAAATALRQHCGIQSRKELRVNKAARDRLLALRDEFVHAVRSGGR